MNSIPGRALAFPGSLIYNPIPSLITVNQNADKDELRAEIKRTHFSRAAFLAKTFGLPEEEVRDFQLKALWQMSAVYRNAPGTKMLAEQYGLSKTELIEFLEKHAREKRSQGDDRPLEPCYDQSTGRYLSFEEWIGQLLKNWNKITIS
jgi:hypothetical protein